MSIHRETELFNQVVNRERALREVRDCLHQETTPELRAYLHALIEAALQDQPWPDAPGDAFLRELRASHQ